MTASERPIAIATSCYQNESMVNVLIRNLPESVHSRLSRRAEAQGQSLQQYLLAELGRLAAQPTIEEVMELAAQNATSSISSDEIVAMIREDRDSR